MGMQGAEIDNEVCDPWEHAPSHVLKPRKLVYGDTED